MNISAGTQVDVINTSLAKELGLATGEERSIITSSRRGMANEAEAANTSRTLSFERDFSS